MKQPRKVPNAQKWTEENVMVILADIKHDCYNGDVLYLGTALARQDLYTQIWHYWKKRFADNDRIIEEMYRIEMKFESRLYEGALKKEVSPWMAVMGLKYNHHWNDKIEEPEEQTTAPNVIRLDANTICYHDRPGVMDTYVKVKELPSSLGNREE